jgi:methylated-DNA-[protein]-cysteine S-methyltransferase
MSEQVLSFVVDSPVGPLVLADTGGRLSGLRLPAVADDGTRSPAPGAGWQPVAQPSPVLRLAADQLDAYFAGDLTRFDLPLRLDGTAFQQRVWQALCEIPYGSTATYGEIAERLDAPGASRAVGLANNRNPVPIVVPCHRVIGADGTLTGFGGGLRCKRWLLDHESSRDLLFTL